ncbi:MAG: glycosyltransferase family 2 protein [Verrucomicrobia bacterium]|nr:glycosyltransferase family 2 protein [Verrucomicrobiota bacterium]
MTERVIAFIPAFNEATRIASVIDGARSRVAEVVVIDDGSQDQTAAAARAAGATVLTHEQNRGKGAAIATALEYFARADASFAVFLDADGQHATEEIPKFVAAARNSGAGIVIGTRMGDTRAMPLVRLWTNRFTSWLASRLAGQRIADSQCGFRLLRRDVLPVLRLATMRFETETEMLIQAGRAGQQIVNVEIRTIYDPTRRSRIRPLRDTARFFCLVKKYWR